MDNLVHLARLVRMVKIAVVNAELLDLRVKTVSEDGRVVVAELETEANKACQEKTGFLVILVSVAHRAVTDTQAQKERKVKPVRWVVKVLEAALVKWDHLDRGVCLVCVDSEVNRERKAPDQVWLS